MRLVPPRAAVVAAVALAAVALPGAAAAASDCPASLAPADVARLATQARPLVRAPRVPADFRPRGAPGAP